ncbi:transposase [Prosthecochloris sp. CIB 2401]|uniref:transposase n=1 Tax=Prosthecochloris sp. CIB 2401 TaxID=1868325 RepID=UPI001F1C0F1E|nr:transposase [Prosthecochloris sp. CIB 2401]
MFKRLILQSLYNLSDDQMEFQITDRLSFKRFLMLKTSDKVPDSKTIWKFRETLIQEGIIEALFCRFNQALDDQSVFANTGQIMDASFVEVPRRTMSTKMSHFFEKKHSLFGRVQHHLPVDLPCSCRPCSPAFRIELPGSL